MLLHKLAWGVAAVTVAFAALDPSTAAVIVAIITGMSAVAVGAFGNHKQQQILLNVDGRLSKLLEQKDALQVLNVSLEVDKAALQTEATAAKRVIADKQVGDAAVAEAKKNTP